MFAKKLAFPELVILVWGLKDLVNVLPEASLLVIVEAHFCGYDFKIKKDCKEPLLKLDYRFDKDLLPK